MLVICAILMRKGFCLCGGLGEWLEEFMPNTAISTHLDLQEACVQAAEKAFARARAVDRGRQRLSQLARMHAHMCQGLGQHSRAAAILTEALSSDLSADATVECLHLRGMY